MAKAASGTRRSGSKNSSKTSKTRSPSKVWTAALIKGGFTVISHFFLEKYHELTPQITHGEAMLIIHLISFKWDEKMPYPAYKTLAKRMLIGHSQARNLARSLQKKGYLKRHVREKETNLFDLEPLFRALEDLMKSEDNKNRKASS